MRAWHGGITPGFSYPHSCGLDATRAAKAAAAAAAAFFATATVTVKNPEHHMSVLL